MSSQKAYVDITRYKIISKIGEGSFSKVYRVKDLQIKKSYAAKVSKIMIDQDSKDSEEVRLLFREVNLMSLLNHPSVLKFIGYYSTNFEMDPLPTIITELALNGSLRDIIKMETQGLSPSEWNFTKKLINIYGIASGMSYLHAHNVLHRDLKPENILVDEYLHPKISDFGLSKITDFLSASMNFQSQKGIKGTPAYMAPEIMSEEKYSKSSDVYAFGFIVYELMTCKEPFENYDIYKLMKKVTNEGYRPSITEDVPNAYRELIEKCWSQEAEERPSFDEIVSELKTNNDFINEVIDETEYYDYVDFIDNYRSTFDVTKRAIHFSNFIKLKGRNREVKPILFGEKLSDDETNTESNNNEDNEKIKDSNESEIKEESIQSKQISSNEKQASLNEKQISSNEKQISSNEKQISSNEKQTSSNEKQQNANEGENKLLKTSKSEDNKSYKVIYPYIELNKLSENNRNLVEMSIRDSEKSFLVGQFLIEGKNGFPDNIELGMKYIEQSVNEKCDNAIVYYIQLLIKGKIIRENLKKANEYLIQLSKTKDHRQFLLQGLMSYKMNRFAEASKFYEDGIQLGDPVCMYKYGKMLFIGEGVKKNIKESIRIFQKSQELGYSKSGYFLASLNSLNKIKKFSKLPSETQMIFIMNNIKNNKNQQEPEFNQIVLSPKKTEIVFFNKSLKSTNFFECLKQYRHISIEIEYPSESFELIIDLVIKMNSKTLYRMNIGVVFSSFEKGIAKECFSPYISYHGINSSIHVIPFNQFKKCSFLKQIIIPSSVTFIGGYAFNKCSSLKQITIPSSITEIREWTFADCSSLKEIAIPSSLTGIGNYAFAGCSSLTQITIPSSVNTIGVYAFDECSSLTQVTFEIPSSVYGIGNHAFRRCSSLKQITIPSSVSGIGDYPFYGCSSLSQITIRSFLINDKLGLGPNVKIIKT